MKGAGDNYRNGKGIGEKFQEETKYTSEKIYGHTLDWASMPERYKEYPDAVGTVPLPEPDLSSKSVNIWDVILKRRSVRNYKSSHTISLSDLALLLWATQGITAASRQFQFRAAPSAGGLYPVETYIMLNRVEDTNPGIYHFRPLKFDLECLREGDFRHNLANAALGQEIVSSAQVCFIWTAVIERCMWKYRQRAFRYIYLDAGHIAQNLYLAGTAAGMGVCGIGAFFDDQVNAVIGVDGAAETALYLASVGWSYD